MPCSVFSFLAAAFCVALLHFLGMPSADITKIWENFSLDDEDVPENRLDSSLQCFEENMIAKIVVVKILAN